MNRAIASCLLLLILPGALPAQRLELAWPTPNGAFRDGGALASYIQPTVSGETTSGLFGCVRSDGTQFHEGLDLLPLTRTARAEPTDQIFAAMKGVVRHINTRPATSSYGRYVVLEHVDQAPAVYTLYAHLSAVASGLKVGETVNAGEVIATMGRSAGGYTIPRERAHLHFEIGVRLTDDFQAWYNARKFGSPNHHRIWNGMNLAGIDPLDFFTRMRDRQVDSIREYFASMEAAVRVRIATSRQPDFVSRYPSLLAARLPISGVAGWEIAISAAGVPFAWIPLTTDDLAGYRANQIRVVEVNQPVIDACHCKSLIIQRNGAPAPGRDLDTLMQQLFGIR